MPLILYAIVRNGFLKKHLPADGHSSAQAGGRLTRHTRELAARQFGKMREHAACVRLGAAEQAKCARRLEYGHAGA